MPFSPCLLAFGLCAAVQAQAQITLAATALRQDAELALTRARYQVLATELARETALAQLGLAVGTSGLPE
jgi:hypothetical protein